VDFCRDKEGNLIGEVLNMKGEGEEEKLERYRSVKPEIERPTIQEVIVNKIPQK
jgi:hypothetical protein